MGLLQLSDISCAIVEMTYLHLFCICCTYYLQFFFHLCPGIVGMYPKFARFVPTFDVDVKTELWCWCQKGHRPRWRGWSTLANGPGPEADSKTAMHSRPLLCNRALLYCSTFQLYNIARLRLCNLYRNTVMHSIPSLAILTPCFDTLNLTLKHCDALRFNGI